MARAAVEGCLEGGQGPVRGWELGGHGELKGGALFPPIPPVREWGLGVRRSLRGSRPVSSYTWHLWQMNPLEPRFSRFCGSFPGVGTGRD